MPEKKLYDWLYSRTWLRQKCQYSRSLPRAFGARCGAVFLHPGHSHVVASSLTRTFSFAAGLIRILSKYFESKDMAGYNNTVLEASGQSKFCRDFLRSGSIHRHM